MTSILALDPGPDQTGWCWLYHDKIGSGVLDNTWMLHALLSRNNERHTVAIEMVASYGMPVGAEVFETVRWVGRFQQAWREPEAVRLVYRKDVKLHLCNSPRANDAAIRQRLIDLYGGKERAIGSKKAPGPLYGVKSHAWAALAVAVTVRDTMLRDGTQ